MFLRQPPCKGHADGAARNMCCPWLESRNNSIRSERYLACRRVIRQHGEHSFDILRGFGRRVCNPRAILSHSLRLLARAVIDGNFMPGTKQIACHPRTHPAQTDKPEFHTLIFAGSASPGVPVALPTGPAPPRS